jgi:hypothetical protein
MAKIAVHRNFMFNIVMSVIVIFVSTNFPPLGLQALYTFLCLPAISEENWF